MSDIDANGPLLGFPFLAIEFKGDGPLWVATNQCLGASATCVNISEKLNKQLRACQNNEVKEFRSAAFSVASEYTFYFPPRDGGQ
jgi:hypothetical protein